MDSVRFGRALGIGARSAAKALAVAVDAATAPNPGKPAQAPGPPAPQPPSTEESTNTSARGPVASAAKTAARATAQAAIQTGAVRENFTRGRKRFGEAVWGPFAKLSRVLWLEMTGFFFGIFAVFAGSAVWTHRADLHSTPTNHDARIHLLVFLIMALAFSYFCISSFVRAYRR